MNWLDRSTLPFRPSNWKWNNWNRDWRNNYLIQLWKRWLISLNMHSWPSTLKGIEANIQLNHLIVKQQLEKDRWTYLEAERWGIQKHQRYVSEELDRVLIWLEKDVLAKGLNYEVTPQHNPVVKLITTTESFIRNNHTPVEKDKQCWLKISDALSNARLPPSNLTTQERRALTSLSMDPNITILPADKGRCTDHITQW